MTWLPWLAPAWACPFGAGEVEARAGDVFERYSQADRDGLVAALGALDEALACPADLLPAPAVAQVHAARAIGWFVGVGGDPRDRDQVRRSFAGARRADPSFDFFARVPDNGNDLSLAWSSSTPVAPPLAPLPGEGWWVDGRAATEAPVAGVATWLQQSAGERVGYSAWAPDGTSSVALPVPVGPTDGGSRRPAWPWMVSAVTTEVLGVGALATAFAVHEGVRRGSLDPDRRGTWQPVNAATAVAGPVLCATGLVTGAIGFALERR